MSFIYKEFPNTGFMEVTLSEDELLPIKNEIQEIQSNFNKAWNVNHTLAGNIAKEYQLVKCKDHINHNLFKYFIDYDNATGCITKSNILTNAAPMVVDNPWVNFQSKHEFNPPHNHSGVLSFVIWIQIPYNIKDEMNVVNCVKSKSPLAGYFSFHYINTIGELSHYHIPADNTMEGKMIIFPSRLTHSVSPFYTSDQYRISVSGNVKFSI
jgi:hypothetical protein